MKRLLLVVFLVMALAVIPLVGCETADDEVVDREPRPEVVEPEPVAPEEPEVVEPVPEAEPEPAVPEEQEVVAPAPEPEAEEPEPFILELSGSGNTLSPSFDLREGIVVVSMEHDGDRYFKVEIIGEEGGTATSASHIGAYSGSYAHQVRSESLFGLEPGEHRIQVEGDGDWGVTVEQPGFPEGDQLPVEYSGVGDTVEGVFVFPAGIAVVDMTHDGDGWFSVRLLGVDNDDRDFVIDTRGSYEGTRVMEIGRGLFDLVPGSYLATIRADGPWSIEFRQPILPEAEEMPVDYSGSGDTILGPVMIPGGITQVHLTHEGDSNFIVKLLGVEVSDREWLVNEIGDYEGTVGVQAVEGRAMYLEPGPYVVSVRGDGAWTIGFGE